MPSKTFYLDGVGDVTIIKRASSRNIRLSIRSDNKVMVSIPRLASYQAGIAFAQSKLEWLKIHVTPQLTLTDGQQIGKQHTLRLIPTRGLSATRTLVSSQHVTVRHPLALTPDDDSVQSAANAACIRALRSEANALLPPRLKALAAEHNFSYNSVQIKRLKGRWGSCDSKQHIVLNLFLMQLPWECIDYVLLHELTHTIIMQHGTPFWNHMNTLMPRLAQVRKQMRSYQPTLF